MRQMYQSVANKDKEMPLTSTNLNFTILCYYYTCTLTTTTIPKEERRQHHAS